MEVTITTRDGTTTTVSGAVRVERIEALAGDGIDLIVRFDSPEAGEGEYNLYPDAEIESVTEE
jgi:hypothetical protein